MKLKSFLFAASMAAVPVAAGAVTIDFTATSTYSGATSSLITGTTAFGVNYSVTGIPNASLNYGETYNGAVNETNGLAEQKDGLGISDDEVSNVPNTPKEVVTVTFGKAVKVTGLHFLDLFRFSADEEERMQVWLNAPVGSLASYFTGGGQDLTVKAKQTPGLGGYKFDDVTMGSNSALFKNVTSISFTASRGNDGAGVADAALAGIDVAPIPLPAGGLLLLGGLGGLAALKRRKKA